MGMSPIIFYDLTYKEARLALEGYEKEQEHLYVSTLFIGSTDDINNYIEVEKPNEIHN